MASNPKTHDFTVHISLDRLENSPEQLQRAKDLLTLVAQWAQDTSGCSILLQPCPPELIKFFRDSI